MKRSVSLFILLLTAASFSTYGQMITGTWKGKINRQKVEVKIIQNGDSLTGTSYYYESANNYRRYSIKGYFDQQTNSAVWWDDQLLEEKSGRLSISTPGKVPMLSRADFNCPGDGKMMLDGKAGKKDVDGNITGEVDLDKTPNSVFEDEWDFIIDNYTSGTNDPEIIDSINQISKKPTDTEPPVNTVTKTFPDPAPVKEKKVQPVQEPVQSMEKPKQQPAPVKKTIIPVTAPSIEEKFTSREKVFIKEIPVSGDSIELRFYDNAEVDGDSISLFLNDALLFKHIRLTGKAYSIKLAVRDLKESNELTMVAENLGAIPPNTSYMVAIVNNQRFDAYLASTEGSSAMIRLTKNNK